MLELLKGYRAFKTPFGGAFAPEDATMKDANYGPSGFIEEGQYYSPKVRQRLKDSYRLLEHAIEVEKRTPEGFTAWLLLHEPYFGDPGDPSVVAHWRQVSPNKAQYHDLFVKRLANHLRFKDLFVIFPAQITIKEQKQIEQRHNEFYDEYERLVVANKNDGLSDAKANKKAVEVASVRHGLSMRRGYEIVQLRGRKSA